MEYNKEVLMQIREWFLKKNETIAVAESVTSGNIQAALSQAKDASQFYQGGITVYNVGQKYKHLSVEPIHALKCECVSEKVAWEMAKNVCIMFNSDYGIGITGFASTQPEKEINTLYAFVAIAHRDKILLQEKITATTEEGYATQLFYTNHILNRLAELVQPA